VVKRGGGLPLKTTGHKRGSLELNGYNSYSNETSMGMYHQKEAMKKSCSDLLVIHQRKSSKGDEITTRGYITETSIECKLI
jgi:hypothetical protein